VNVKTVLVDLGHGIEWPFEHGAQLIKTVDVAMKDEPEAKAAIVGLLTQISAVTASGAIVVSSKGVDLAADAAAIVAAKQLFLYVENTFLPAVKTIYGDLAPEIEGLAASAPIAPAAPQPGPGLHTVVPA
jgi:hypothetical protein